MKCIIFAGGKGTRLQEETLKLPKPLVEVGNKPLLWHIMKIYSFYGIEEFIILAGYKQHLIKEFFNNYYLHNCNVTFYLNNNRVSYNKSQIDDWKVTVVNTGLDTLTGGRLKQVRHLLDNDRTFLLTYGDGLSNVNINKIIQCHNYNKNIVTLTAVNPEGKYGVIKCDENNKIIQYEEKPSKGGNWINGGFMVCDISVFDYLLESDFSDTLKILSNEEKLGAYEHWGYWKSVDTVHDLDVVQDLWNTNKAEWKLW